MDILETARLLRLCSVDGCEQKSRKLGMCDVHYHRVRKHGRTDLIERTKADGPCSVDGCTKRERSRQLCGAHYNRWKKYGDPTAGRPARARPGEARHFVEDVAVPFTGRECLTWPYGKYPNGYGQIGTGRGTKVVSRLVCELAHGLPPTPKHEAAHSCANGHSGCVNPRHLSWATSKENKADVVIHTAAGLGRKAARLRQENA